MQSKNMLVFILLLIFISCSNPADQEISNVMISFKNKSIYQLNNLIVSNRTIGDLIEESSSKYISFDSFKFDTGMPDEDASAEINGRIVSNHFRNYWCGTEKITIDKGIYIIEIEVIDSVLILTCNNSPRIP